MSACEELCRVRAEDEPKAFIVERWSVGERRPDERDCVLFTSDSLDECRQFVRGHPQQWAYLKVVADLDKVWALIKDAPK